MNVVADLRAFNHHVQELLGEVARMGRRESDAFQAGDFGYPAQQLRRK
jgi:hypothetical protein